ncbi:MAG: hypothetical protein SPL80_00830 [Bacilli bacterium]|nr:hypothetical protein [Bacilli bacterium]
MIRHLLICEGEKPEFRIITGLLQSYGFSVTKEVRTSLPIDGKKIPVTYLQLTDQIREVVVIKDRYCRIGELLVHMDTEWVDLGLMLPFQLDEDEFASILFLHDVDHASDADLRDLMAKLNNPEEGLLLISNPCIEALGDFYESHIHVHEHCKEYKKVLERRFTRRKSNIGTSSSFSAFLAEQARFFMALRLCENVVSFQEKDLLLHPSLFVDRCVRTNHTNNGVFPADFSPISSVAYVLVGCIFNLFAQEDNSSIVLDKLKENTLISWTIVSCIEAEGHYISRTVYDESGATVHDQCIEWCNAEAACPENYLDCCKPLLKKS